MLVHARGAANTASPLRKWSSKAAGTPMICTEDEGLEKALWCTLHRSNEGTW